jgi:hypothetical protein
MLCRRKEFVNNVKYLGVIFDKKITWGLHIKTIKITWGLHIKTIKITWGLHIKTIETKAFRTFIRAYSLFKSEHLSTNIKLTLYKALIRSIMTYASRAWEFAANTHLLKLQRLQNKVLRIIRKFQRRTPVRQLHKAFNIPYIYDYITKICRKQARVIENHKNAYVRHIGQGEARHRKHKRLKLCGGQAYDRSSV